MSNPHQAQILLFYFLFIFTINTICHLSWFMDNAIFYLKIKKENVSHKQSNLTDIFRRSKLQVKLSLCFQLNTTP